jgi:hypothetical protein
MEKIKLDEQKLNSLKTYRDKWLRTVIGCVVALSIFTIWALSTVENGAKAENEVKADTNSWIEIKDLCDELFIQEVNNVKIWEQNIDWAMKLLYKAECDYTYQQVSDAIWFDDWLLCPVELWREYGWQCTDHLNDWYPGKLNADWTSQEMPEVKWTDSHQRFKELCQAYWLDPSKIWELENRYNLREGVLLAILIAETSWGHNWEYVDEGCYNLGNVGNDDSWDRVCFEWKWESIEQVAMTLNNRYLWNVLTLGCLSNAWSCVKYFDREKRYATSNGNRERNMLNVLNTIYEDELGEINASKFSVRRDFISLQ